MTEHLWSGRNALTRGGRDELREALDPNNGRRGFVNIAVALNKLVAGENSVTVLVSLDRSDRARKLGAGWHIWDSLLPKRLASRLIAIPSHAGSLDAPANRDGAVRECNVRLLGRKTGTSFQEH